MFSLFPSKMDRPVKPSHQKGLIESVGTHKQVKFKVFIKHFNCI